ncbi:protein translocase subunit SecD [Octadecabacter sp. 1_MG-2023]|uniref:protein translocase subunit SecD n=1 Tax=unclassified Octadecabacter TaxID=196158 RepID=UPI001C094A0A|nr:MULTISPECIES: protein translocase subunit SecD [unclassified Octadecabacter]MBU2993750.1 protein translocase subunit SecD [Octadecabacter sp. B2R22]MDO6735405.1 protein translocase subunit SecD [Octadecabacter sp. 1_MG-2023]
MLKIDPIKRIAIWLVVAFGIFVAMPNGFYGTVERSNDAETAIAEEFTAAELEAKGLTREGLEADAASWPTFMPDNLVNLGLDLRGGAQLLAEVKVEQVYEARMRAMWSEVRDTLAAERDVVGFVTDESDTEGELRVRISEPAGMDRALELVRGLAQPVVSVTTVGQVDIQVASISSTDLVIQLTEAEKVATDDRTVRQALEIVRRRIDETGTREPSIQRQGEARILIQVPGVGSAQEVKDIIGTTAQLGFHPVVGSTSDPDARAGAGNMVIPSLDQVGQYYIVERSPVVTGEDLVDSQPTFDQNNRPAVTFRFNASGARRFGDYTADNIGSPFAIVLDNEVVSAPTIQSHISGGSGIITGQFTVQESTQLAVLLRAGALPAELDFLQEQTVGPDLGQDSINAGAIACVVAFALVLVYMVLSYGLLGVFANIALLVNVALIFAMLSLIGGTLTLPGIAGIVLTIGMAVDANVLVFERIREESKTAKGPARAIELGYEKALSAIIDANITTFITAVILFAMGAGPVRGFAITLGLGIITSVFTAIFLTRLLVVIWFERKRPKALFTGRYLKLVKADTAYDFFSRAKVWLGVSAVLVAVALGSFFYQGLNFGIDFKGGTTLRTQSEISVDVAEYRAALAPLELGEITITEVFDPTFADDENVATVAIQAQDDEEAVTNETIQAVQAALQTIDPAMTFPAVESVGPTVSGELIQAAILAVVLAIGAVLVYIWLRFEWQFALGAVAALVHDVVLTIGIFSELQIRFDLAIIAALLTIVGYSLNDTVVVFDRVRENLRKFKTKTLKDVLNMSINETLSRTFMTSFTTLLALIALYVLGGDVIRGFVFAMIWGVIVGTYSSIFVASSTLLVLGVKRDWSKEAKKVGGQFADIDA